MAMNTCGNCPYVKLNKTRLMTIAYCGKTEDGLIVPHEWDGPQGTIIYTRVPEFCENPDAKPSKRPAPRKDWIKIDLNAE